MAKQQGGLAYLIGLLVFILILVAPTQYSGDIKTIVHSAAAKVGLVTAKEEPAPEPKPGPPAPTPAKPAPTPQKPTPAPTKPAPPPEKPKATPAPKQPAPKPETKPAPKPEAKPAPKPAPKPETKPAAKPAPKPPAKAETKPAPKPPVKAEKKPAPEAETKPAPKPAPEKKPAPPKEQPKKEDKKAPDGGGIGLPFAQQAPQPQPAPPAPAQPAVDVPIEEGEGAIANLIDKIPSARFTLADALVKSVDKSSAAKELIQYIEYFIVGYLIVANNTDTERSFRRIVRLLILTSTIVIAVAMFQYWSCYCPCVKDTAGKLGPLSGPLTRLLHVDQGDAMGIRGTFSNRNVLGAFLAMMLPLLWGVALAHKKGLAIVTRTWAVILTVAGLSVMTSGGAMIAVLFSILAITFIRDEKFFSILAVLVLVFAIGAGLFLKSKLQRLEAKCAARPNITMLQDSVKLFKQSDAKPPRNYGWQQRYVEWQAAVNAITVHPILGVGVGNYQQNINQYYGEIAKPAENYMEADAMNGLLILGMTMGLPGLVAFLWILFKFQKFGAQGFSLLPPGLEKGFALGIYGAMTSVLIASLFTNVLVRGVGLVFIILLALAGQVNDLAPDEAPEEQPKEEEGEKPKS